MHTMTKSAALALALATTAGCGTTPQDRGLSGAGQADGNAFSQSAPGSAKGLNVSMRASCSE